MLRDGVSVYHLSILIGHLQVIQNAISKELDSQCSPSNARQKNECLETLQALHAIEGNSLCADCRAENPDWVSLNLGILICKGCSGFHRNLGKRARIRFVAFLSFFFLFL